MDMKRKMQLAEQSIKLITRADDTDSLARAAAVDRLQKLLETEKAELRRRAMAQIDADDKKKAEG